MSNSSFSNEYLLLSRGQWDAEKSQEQIQSTIDNFYVWYERLVFEGKFRRYLAAACGSSAFKSTWRAGPGHPDLPGAFVPRAPGPGAGRATPQRYRPS